MQLFRVRNFDDYKKHAERNRQNDEMIERYESSLVKKGAQGFTVSGISYPANRYVDFKVDYLYSDGISINWRERIVCPITGLNNRLRACVHIMDFELTPYPDSTIYITEQVTPLFAFLKTKFVNLIGSEYLGIDSIPGSLKGNIRNEDMTNLSFGNETIDYYLSFECFEHIPFYQKAISEVQRVLRPGGIFLGSFPFDANSHPNLIRATVDQQGNIIHFTKPEYHGDPVRDNGILCFTVFGWEILDEFRGAGFKDAYAIFLWSDIFAYLGGYQIFFIAKK
jgi:SAM-dependent methyltransferase